ncbi:hypothetical protein [Planococcus soli]|uniref:hypothetical protein n=1 Tax=Planococcus soli TaxID=2666072 RepID=UPI00115D918A|nr:hypothetical protein [Planococcus soli]
MWLLIIWLIVIFGFGFLRMYLKKRFGIDEEERAGVPVKRFERWNGWVMLAAIIVLYIVFIDSLAVFFFWLLSVFLLVCAAQIYLEWKYLKGSRKYQASIVYFTITALVMIIFIAIIRCQTELF